VTPVGRKTRRAADSDFRFGEIAPVLSRGVWGGSSPTCLKSRCWVCRYFGEMVHARSGSNPARYYVLRWCALGAPRFSPYRAIRGDKSNPTHTCFVDWASRVPEITTSGLALFWDMVTRTERLKSGAVSRLEVVRPWRAEIFALPAVSALCGLRLTT